MSVWYVGQFPRYPLRVWKALGMARTTASPLVDHTHLVQPEGAAEAILVRSPDWYAWLQMRDTTDPTGQHVSR